MKGVLYYVHFYPRSPCGERQCRYPRALRWAPYFYPRSPCGERRRHNSLPPLAILFLSTLSLRRATAPPIPEKIHCAISIHALLAESDRPGTLKRGSYQKFLSTLSLRRATPQGPEMRQSRDNFYPRSPCGERLQQAITAEQTARISIHALLAESDPRSPKISILPYQFLSTLSLRRATGIDSLHSKGLIYFYPRSPCGERR